MKKNLFRVIIFAVLLAALLHSIFAETVTVSSSSEDLSSSTLDELVIDGEYVKNIPIGTTAEELLGEFSGGDYVINFHGYSIGPYTRVGTGYKLLMNDKTEYTLLVDGDIDGDTYVTGRDLVRAKKHLIAGDNFCYEYVLDLNRDGSFTEADLSGLSELIMTDVPELNIYNREMVMTEKYVTIENLGSKKFLNVYGNENKDNANVDVYEYDGTSGQFFKFVKDGDAYVIVPKCATSRAVNVYGSSAKADANICLWSKTGHSTQAFIIEFVESLNGYVIRSADNSKYVLTATGSKNSSNVCLKEFDPENKYQIWTSAAFGITLPEFEKEDDNIQNEDDSLITTAQIQSVLDKYEYFDGRFWTLNETKGGQDDVYSDIVKSYTDELPSSKTKATTSNNYKSYNYQSQWECHGFASYVMANVTKTDVRPTHNIGKGWKKIEGEKNIESLKIGDIIRTKDNSGIYHTAIVLSIEENECTFVECWGSKGCEINIGGYNGKYTTLKAIEDNYVLEYIFRYVGK